MSIVHLIGCTSFDRVVSGRLACEKGCTNRRVICVGGVQRVGAVQFFKIHLLGCAITAIAICFGSFERHVGRLKMCRNVKRHYFTVTNLWSWQRWIFLKPGPTATATSSRCVGQPLTKICQILRNILWFLDWVWISFLGWTMPKWAENWFPSLILQTALDQYESVAEWWRQVAVSWATWVRFLPDAKTLLPHRHFVWHCAHQCSGTRTFKLLHSVWLFSSSLDFYHWRSRADRVLTLNMNIQPPLFGSTWGRASPAKGQDSGVTQPGRLV